MRELRAHDVHSFHFWCCRPRISPSPTELRISLMKTLQANRVRLRLPSLDRASKAALDRFGVLQPQEVILGLLGEYIGRNEKVWSGGLVSLLGDLGFSAAASRIALNRVVTRGLLRPSRAGRFISYSITPRLAALHEEGRRLVFTREANPSWDGAWTLVRYSIPEELRPQRARLSRWMAFRGFGSLQDGIWVAAGNRQREVISLTRQLKLSPYVMVFLGALPSQSAGRDVALQGWNLAALGGLYEIFVRTFSQYCGKKALMLRDARECFILRTRLIEMFRQTAVYDPNFPDRILQIKWKRRESIELFQLLQSELKNGAREYFRGYAVS